MKMKLNKRKIIYIIVALILLIALIVLLITHYNNKYLVSGKNKEIKQQEKVPENVVATNEEEKIKPKTKYKKKLITNKDNLDNIEIEVLKNNEIIKDNTIKVTKEDIIDIKVKNINTKYKVYYALKNEITTTDFILLKDGKIFKDYTPYTKLKLLIKIVTKNNEKIYEKNEFKLYDIVYKYDKNEELNEDIIVGELDDKDYKYDDKEKNKDIVIEDVTNLENNDNKVNIDEKKDAVVNIKGNIYLVDKTDISELELTGYLYIDTDSEITFNKYAEKIDLKNIYTISILSKEFNLNGKKYIYEIIKDNVCIKKILDDKNYEDSDLEDNFNENIEISKDENDNLIISKKDN